MMNDGAGRRISTAAGLDNGTMPDIHGKDHGTPRVRVILLRVVKTSTELRRRIPKAKGEGNDRALHVLRYDSSPMLPFINTDHVVESD